MNILGRYLPHLKNKDAFLDTSRRLRLKRLEIEHWKKISALRERCLSLMPGDISFSPEEFINLSSGDNLTAEFISALKDYVQKLIPWRTGPFNFFGLEIDSEWKSNARWDRLKPFLPDLKNKIIADIGCGNGYFVYRMLKDDPKIIFGLDPQPRCILQLELLNLFLKDKRVVAEPLGIENMDVFTSYFDFVLCMGVIYHRRDPHTCLTKVKESLKKGGQFIIETLIVDSEEEMSFSPPDRYMKMRNVWFVPSSKAMCSWLKKSGFKDIREVLVYDVNPDEQRRTFYSPDESLSDFVDPSDPAYTIEGYKMPKRAIFSCVA